MKTFTKDSLSGKVQGIMGSPVRKEVSLLHFIRLLYKYTPRIFRIIQYRCTTKNASYQCARAIDLVPLKEYIEYMPFYEHIDTLDVDNRYRKDICTTFSNIKYKPVKRFFSDYAHFLRCGDAMYVPEKPDDSAGLYDPIQDVYKFNYKIELNNELGSCNTHFHEMAHQIDHHLGKSIGACSWSFANCLRESVQRDYNFVLKQTKEAKRLSTEEAQKEISTELKKHPEEANIVSDVFGGVTLNQVHGVYVHRKDYWKENIHVRVAQEVFAEITADIASGNVSHIEFSKKYLLCTIEKYYQMMKGLYDENNK